MHKNTSPFDHPCLMWLLLYITGLIAVVNIELGSRNMGSTFWTHPQYIFELPESKLHFFALFPWTVIMFCSLAGMVRGK